MEQASLVSCLSVTCGLDLYGSGEDPFAGSSEHGNEALGSVKDGEYLH
jgi:hypothetical protein